MAFTQVLDIQNRALQHCGVPRVTAGQATRGYSETLAAYDGIRLSELQRNLWRCTTRRARLRPLASTTQLYIPNAWVKTTAYTVGQIASYAGYYWFLNVPTSTGEQPDISPSWQHYFGPLTMDTFDSTDAGYDVSEIVIGSNTNFYISLLNTNTADPTTAPAGSWAQITGTKQNVIQFWPIGGGPVSDRTSLNVYRLPSGYLREAPQNPKTGVNVYLGMATGDVRTDWTYEGDFFVSSESRPIVFRFGADLWDVARFSPMLCEGIAARLALEVVETLTQSPAKRQAIQATYDRVMGEARLRNQIEKGEVFPPLDGYIACRL